MIIKYNVNINNKVILNDLDRLTNQIFKLLPWREEGGNWEAPLKNIILEFAGMNRLLPKKDDDITLFRLLCKLEALLNLTEPEDFLMFRTTIFECLSLLNSMKKGIENE